MTATIGEAKSEHRNSIGFTIGSEAGRHNQGAQIVWGYNATGARVWISDASRGRQTGLTCECGVPLVAKKGSELAHHFAHEAGSAGICNEARNAALANFAISALSGEAGCKLPKTTHRNKTPAIRGIGFSVVFGIAKIEAEFNSKPVYIYLVTRRSDMVALRARHLCPDVSSSFVIDLSTSRTLADPELLTAVLSSAHREWVNNRSERDAAAAMNMQTPAPFVRPVAASALRSAVALVAPDKPMETDSFRLDMVGRRLERSVFLVKEHRPEEAANFLASTFDWLGGLNPVDYNIRLSDLDTKVERWLGLRDEMNRPTKR